MELWKIDTKVVLQWKCIISRDPTCRYLAFVNTSDTTQSVEGSDLLRARTHALESLMSFGRFTLLVDLPAGMRGCGRCRSTRKTNVRLTWYIDRPRSIGSSDLSSWLHWQTISNCMLGSVGMLRWRKGTIAIARWYCTQPPSVKGYYSPFSQDSRLAVY